MNELTQINVILRSISSQVIPSSAQQHPISQPAAVQTLPIGTILSGNIVGKEPKGGGFILKTPKGDIFVKSELPLIIGSKLELIIENAGENIRARILTIDGKTPSQLLHPEGQQDELVVAANTKSPQAEPEELITYGRNFRNLALADQARRALEILASNITSESEVRVQIEQPLTERINFLKTQLPPKLAEALQNVQNGTPLKIKLLPDINLNTLQEISNKPVVIDLESIPLPKTQPQVPATDSPNLPLIPKQATTQTLAAKPEQISPVVIQSIIEENISQITDESNVPFQPRPVTEKPAAAPIYSISSKEAADALLQPTPNKGAATPVLNARGTGIESLPATNSRIVFSGNTLYIPTEIFMGAGKTDLRIATPLGIFKPVEAALLPFTPQPQQEITMVLATDDPPSILIQKEGIPDIQKLSWKEVSGRFENLDAFVRAASQMPDAQQVMQTLTQTLPRPDGKMAASMLFILSAISGGNIRKIFGESFDAIADTAERIQIARKALTELAAGNEETVDKNGIRWQTFYVPVYDGHSINQLALYVSREKGHESNQDENGSDETRFVFDIKLSHLGRMQIDGFLQGNKNIDVVVRTETPLPPYMKTEMHHLFGNAMELTGYNGSIAFFITREFVGDSPAAPPSDSESEGVVV